MIIKFRGKCENKWVYGDLVHGDENGKENVYILSYGINGLKHKVNPRTVGQYINKKDVDKKDMYYGDIIEVSYPQYKNDSDYRMNWLPHNEVIIWYDFRWGSKRKDNWPGVFPNGGATWKVIGNIYDNPELLR